MEQYKVSARKYRPGIFRDVVGQQHITTTLQKAIKNKRFAHSYLFCGPRGIGKTTCARILAKAINCQNLTEEGEPCNECDSCQRFINSSSLNIYELDAASNNTVEDIRSLIEQVRFPPQSGKYKVYVIDEVHMLSQQAFNAFLKTLEEPPDYAIFILATTEKQKILPTILSRCQIFDFNRIKVSDIKAYLQEISKQEDIEAAEEALQIIAQKAEGALRDALSLFDKIVSFSEGEVTYQSVIDNLNILDYDYFFKVTEALLAEDAATLLNIFDQVLYNGFEGDEFINGLSQHFRDLLVCKDDSTQDLLEVTGDIKDRYHQQARLVPADFLISALDIMNQCDVGYKTSKNKRLHVEMALIKLSYINQTLHIDQNSDTPTSQESTSPTKKKDKEEITTSAASSSSNSSPSPPSPSHSQKSSPQSDSSTTQTTAVKSHSYIKKEPTSGKRKSPSFKLDQTAPPPPPPSSSQKSPSPSPSSTSSTKTLEQKPLVKAWQDFAAHIKDQPKSDYFYASLKNKTPQVESSSSFTIEVENKMQKKRIIEEKTQLMEYLREALQIPQLSMNIKVNPSTSSQQRQPYTKREKYQKMVEKNPALKELKEKFDLDIEF